MTPSMLLCIETATPVCSVTLSDGIVISERRSGTRGAHAEQLPVFVQELLRERGYTIRDLDAIVLSAGPGSYTGLRIGASIAKGMLFGQATPLYAVNTLAALAEAAKAEGPVVIHAVVDARRTHLYHQVFRVEGRLLHAVGMPVAKELSEINHSLNAGECIVGTGWNRLDPDKLKGIQTMGQEVISARCLDAIYRSAKSSDGAYGSGIIWPAKVEIFEPDYRGNPYQ